MTERTKGMGEIAVILALCAVVLIGIVAVISHIASPTVAATDSASNTATKSN